MSSSSPADSLKEEGLTLAQRGQYDAALEKFETAVQAYTTAGEPAGRAEMLNNIGVVQRLRGRLPEAMSALDEAEQYFKVAGDLNRRGQVLGNLGDLYARRKAYDEAIDAYRRSASCLGEAADDESRRLQSQVLRTLSLLFLRRRRWLDAILTMEDSLAVRPRLNPFEQLFYGLLRLFNKLFSGS